MSPWLVAVIVLAALVVGLGAWVVVDQTRSSSVEGQAPPEVAAMLNDRLAALNSGDAKAIAAFYTKDAVLEELDVTPPVVSQGSEAIGTRIEALVKGYGMQLAATSPPVQFGPSVVAEGAKPLDESNPDPEWILVYLLNADGKIAYQWVLGINVWGQ